MSPGNTWLHATFWSGDLRKNSWNTGCQVKGNSKVKSPWCVRLPSIQTAVPKACSLSKLCMIYATGSADLRDLFLIIWVNKQSKDNTIKVRVVVQWWHQIQIHESAGICYELGEALAFLPDRNFYRLSFLLQRQALFPTVGICNT